jgi:hypothetical protein
MENDNSGRWFAIADDGRLYCLADCGDMEAAEESAADLGINPIWIIDPETARQWRDLLQAEATP